VRVPRGVFWDPHLSWLSVSRRRRGTAVFAGYTRFDPIPRGLNVFKCVSNFFSVCVSLHANRFFLASVLFHYLLPLLRVLSSISSGSVTYSPSFGAFPRCFITVSNVSSFPHAFGFLYSWSVINLISKRVRLCFLCWLSVSLFMLILNYPLIGISPSWVPHLHYSASVHIAFSSGYHVAAPVFAENFIYLFYIILFIYKLRQGQFGRRDLAELLFQ